MKRFIARDKFIAECQKRGKRCAFFNIENSYYPARAEALGVDIETGGHVFQFNFSNSTGINERAVINETLDTWEDGGIHFGFNIARVFTIKKAKKLGW